MRSWFEVIQKFTYANGTPDGVLRTIVNSKAAVTRQLAANAQWLKAHGHLAGSVVVTPCQNPNQSAA